jgi:hypothetical protein
MVVTMRTVCPQVKGIYRNNHPEKGSQFPFLYLSENNPDAEYHAIDAYECNKYCVINPAKQSPEPHLPCDFGDYYQF